MKLIVMLISVLSCTQSFNALKNIKHFEADFRQVVKSGNYVYKNYSGHLWYSEKKVKIEITSPDTEYVLIDDSTVRTLNPADSTLIIQKKLRDVDFFFNMMKKPGSITGSDDGCIATVIPDSGNIDSMKVFYDSNTIKEVSLYQGEIEVRIEIIRFKIHTDLPDSIFKLPYMAGIHIIRF